VTICQPWRPANSLNQLKAQANTLAPNRAKGADGTIGDAAHQAEACASQHNSCCVRVAGIWIVRALDLTHDPAHGFDSYAVAEQLRLSRDPRIRYIISNGRITGPNYGWVWHTYNGTDPHKNHVHVSVWDDQARFDDTTRAWRITPLAPAAPQEVEMYAETFFSCAGVTNSPKFFGTPGGLCTWIQSPAAEATLDALENGQWIDQIAPAHTDGAAPPIDRSLIHILGAVPKGFEDCAAFKPVALDPAQVKQAIQEALDAVNADPGNEVSLSAAGLASVAEAVATRIGQKLGTVTP
jgi:hypothetical protein